jgi:hypothetical protein
LFTGNGELFGATINDVTCGDSGTGHYSLSAPLADFTIENSFRSFNGGFE